MPAIATVYSLSVSLAWTEATPNEDDNDKLEDDKLEDDN
jgi:hypothetical protein